MSDLAYYNEIDPHAAAWLRELIAAGHIAPGVVDERSIEDVRPEDLRGFAQCHFFAGIGVWSYALRRAGWADDRPVWTGSCPCQPFSTAGKGTAFADERHLWPHFHWLIEQCRPPVVFGEQVASKDADPWLDLVSTDLEALGFAVGAVAFPSAGVGAPHIRDRTYWMADATSQRQHRRGAGETSDGRIPARVEFERLCNVERLGNTDLPRLEGLGGGYKTEGGRIGAAGSVAEAGESGGLDDTEGKRWGFHDPAHQWQADAQINLFANTGGGEFDRPQGQRLTATPTGPTNGFWRDADWLLCRDGKWRPVEPGTFPLAHGVAGRVGLLRGYGNAINAEAAQAFIEVAMEAMQ